MVVCIEQNCIRDGFLTAQRSLATVETWLFTGVRESVYFDGRYSSNIGQPLGDRRGASVSASEIAMLPPAHASTLYLIIPVLRDTLAVLRYLVSCAGLGVLNLSSLVAMYAEMPRSMLLMLWCHPGTS